jgi:hypothetical protein
MKKLLVVLVALALMSGMALAQDPSYYVDYFSNNQGPVPGAPDQVIRIINVGLTGTPLASPVGDICANIYVFDNNQEMAACCSCRLTPNELASASIGTQLTNNPVTSVVPTFGVVKIAPTLVPAGGCSPTAPLGGAAVQLAQVWGTHLQVTGGATFVTETEKQPSILSADEGNFLTTACSFAHYLGSGKGTCSCTVPGH